MKARLGWRVDWRRCRGRTKLTRERVITTDMAALGIGGNLVRDKRIRKAAIHRRDPATGRLSSSDHTSSAKH